LTKEFTKARNSFHRFASQNFSLSSKGYIGVIVWNHTHLNKTMSSPDQPPSLQKLHVSHASAKLFTASLLEAHGVAHSHASTIAHALVLADLRGVDSHGINRLPSYLARIRAGVLNPKTTPKLTQVTPVVAHIDGQNGFGFVSAHMGMQRCIEMAQEFGIGMCAVKHSNHFGMSAWIVEQAVDANMMSLVFTNSSPALPAWGGKEKLMGVSPIACGAPGKENGNPFILDMAPSVAARGKVYKALRRGEKIPVGWALNKMGKATEDPKEALEGVMLPMAGPKGSALAVMMDVFSGVLSGSAFAGEVTGPYDVRKEADVGHFLVAIKPDLFMDLEMFRERMEVLYRKVVWCERMEGVERIYFPGEKEQIVRREREGTGIPFVKDEIEALNLEAERVGSGTIEILGNIPRAKL
jgi:LDH2 family malate/lactate/ureidoglycolate dehydrogenase